MWNKVPYSTLQFQLEELQRRQLQNPEKKESPFLDTEQSTYFRVLALARPQLNTRTNRNKIVTKVISYLFRACTSEKQILFEGKQLARAGKLGSESQVIPTLFTLLEYESKLEPKRPSLAVQR